MGELEIIDAELKTCPFCGGKAVALKSFEEMYVVRCKNQECVACDMNTWSFTPDEAVDAWNGRAV